MNDAQEAELREAFKQYFSANTPPLYEELSAKKVLKKYAFHLAGAFAAMTAAIIVIQKIDQKTPAED
jgi:hypothetical protein